MKTGNTRKVYRREELEILGFSVLVERKKMKNMYLRLGPTDPQIKVTAPLGVPKETIQEFVRERKPWILENLPKIQERAKVQGQMTQKRKKQYRQYLETILPSIIRSCEEITGLHAKEWRFRDMKTRWGTCNVREKRIWLSLRLAEKPKECIEYVVFHELTHFLEGGHNQVFWGYMDRFCPNWRALRRRLNEPENLWPDRERNQEEG